MVTVQKERYKAFDWLKGLCAILVIFAHSPFPGAAGQVIIDAVCRETVPVFLMITGFFYGNIAKHKREEEQISKIWKLIIWSNALYLIWQLVLHRYTDGEYYWYYTFINFETFFNWLIFNKPPFCVPLYYLNAILYVLYIVAFFDTVKTRKILYYFIPVSFLLSVFLSKYWFLLGDAPFEDKYFLNYFFVGLPYFLIGDIIGCNKEKIVSFFKNNTKRMVLLGVSIAVLCVIGVINESYFAGSLEGKSFIYQVVNIILVLAKNFMPVLAFIFAISVNFKENKFNNLMSTVGRKYSLNMYIFHIIMIEGFDVVKKKLGLQYVAVMEWIDPVVAILGSLAMAIALDIAVKLFYKCSHRLKEALPLGKNRFMG